MGVPILKQGRYLIATIQTAPTDADLQGLRNGLVAQVGRYRARGMIIDITALDVMDSFAVRTLRDIAQMARLCGADTVIVGIQPEVALSMVQLGLTLEGVHTALDLEEGLAFLDERTRRWQLQAEYSPRSCPTPPPILRNERRRFSLPKRLDQ
jgi:rsbT antagonist protein RsbS